MTAPRTGTRLGRRLAGLIDRVTLAGVLAATLLLIGCGDPATTSPTASPTASRDEGVATDGTTPHTPPESDAAADPSPAPSGWPAGDDPTAALTGLGKRIEELFTAFQPVSKQIYPLGYVKLCYKPEAVTPEVTKSDAEGRPEQAVVRIKYQKVSSIIHPTEEAAKADEDLIPYPAEETKAAMTGRRFAKPWPPIEAEITYQLKDGNWVRTDYKTAAVGREGADWLDRIGVP